MAGMKIGKAFLSFALLAGSVSGLRAETWDVGILVYSGVYNTEFVAPYDVFQHADRAEHSVRVFLVAPDDKPIVSAEGMRVTADFTFGNHPPIDILIIPSFENYENDLGGRAEVIDWVRQESGKARFVLSNCWGAFFLAQAGLLNGRHAMTYPPDIDKLGKMFPSIRVVHGHRFVRDGKFVTGGGGVASYENALYVVQELWGAPLARRIASGLVMEWDLDRVDHFLAPSR